MRSKKKIPKTSPKNKELFGTDDDEDEKFFENNDGTNTKNDKKVKSSVFETPVNKKSIAIHASSSSSSSTKKKRKRDKSSECEQEKRDMNTWLSKKRPSSSDKDSKHASTSKSSSSKCRTLKMTKKEKSQKIAVDTGSRPKSEPSFELPSMEELEVIRNKTKLTQKENAIVRAELDKMRTSPPKEVEFL